jgi:uncharacterized protein (DUF1697 family)
MGEARAWAALLRGINVGGRHRMPMAELRALLVAEGCTGVRTLIQSGNALFHAEGERAALSARLAAAIAARFGFPVPVVLLDPGDFADARSRHPFLDGEGAPGTLSVGFLADIPTRAQVAALDPDRSPGDRFAVQGRRVYLHCPRGFARTRLTTAWFDRGLGTTLTVRNWKTLGRLADAAAER